MSTLPLFDRQALGEPAPKKGATLRDYQESAIRSLRAHVVAGRKRVLLVAPTGSGKMVIVASIIKTSTVPVLFVCHRMELIDQCVRELADLGITNVGVMRGDDDRTDPSASIQIASIQTLMRRAKPPAGLVLIDEAHRSAAESYRVHVFDAYPEAIVVGFTASPIAASGHPLGDSYQQMDVTVTYSTLIRRKFIVEPDCFSTPLQPEMTGVHVSQGDFDENELATVMGRRELVGGVVQHWLELAHKHPVFNDNGDRYSGKLVDGPRRPTFCFAVNVAHSEALCQEFVRGGVRVAHLDGKTPENQRRAMLRDLASGQLEVISNCNVLLEGVDVPPAKCVVHARPTLSLVLWMQSTGRILRPWCPSCHGRCDVDGHRSVQPLLLDHAGNYDRHGPPHEDRKWSLKDGVSRAPGQAPTKLCKSCFAYVPSGKIICPFCGAEFPRSHAMPVPTQSAGKLERRTDTTEDQQREFFNKTVRLAMARGFKPGFPIMKFKEEYGCLPPRAWGDEVRSAFNTDVTWQTRVRDRAERKAQEEANGPSEPQGAVASVQQHAAPPPEPEPETVQLDDESFSAWLESEGIVMPGDEDPWQLDPRKVQI